jgi:hypothetical protein
VTETGQQRSHIQRRIVRFSADCQPDQIYDRDNHRKVLNLDGAKQGRHFDDSTQRSASNECVRLIRKLRWIGMDDEAEWVLEQLSGWPFRPTEIVIAGQWSGPSGAIRVGPIVAPHLGHGERFRPLARDAPQTRTAAMSPAWRTEPRPILVIPSICHFRRRLASDKLYGKFSRVRNRRARK